MTAMASQITSLTIAYLIVYSGSDQRKHQSPAWLAFVRGIHRRPVNSPHKLPVMRKMIPFDDVIMLNKECENITRSILSPWMAFSSYGSCQLSCGIRFMISELTSLWYMFAVFEMLLPLSCQYFRDYVTVILTLHIKQPVVKIMVGRNNVSFSDDYTRISNWKIIFIYIKLITWLWRHMSQNVSCVVPRRKHSLIMFDTHNFAQITEKRDKQRGQDMGSHI